MDQDTTWYGGRPRPKRHCVRWGTSYAHGKGHSSPQFSVHVYCGQNDWMDKDVTWYGGKTWPRDILLDGDSAPPARKGAHPQFSVHVYCGQMAGWIRIPLGTEVGLVPGDIVSDGDPAPPRKGAQFVYAVSAIFLLPVSAYALVWRRLSPFCNLLHQILRFSAVGDWMSAILPHMVWP